MKLSVPSSLCWVAIYPFPTLKGLDFISFTKISKLSSSSVPLPPISSSMDSPTPSTHLSQPSSLPLLLKDDPTTTVEPTPVLKRKTPTSPSPRPRRPRSKSIDSPNQSAPPRRKSKNRAVAVALAAPTSPPRNNRRARRRLEKEIAIGEESELVPIQGDAVVRPRKRRQKSEQPQLALVASHPSSSCSEAKVGENNVWEVISELVMWKNVAKSTLWFGSGSMFFFSSCFSTGSNFSIISAASHLGIVILGLAFFRDSLPQRQQEKPREVKFQLTEEDFVRAARLILPTANAVLAKCQKIFSGEPSTTLKVAPVLLFTAKYGHLITPWRFLATGFFLSFTLPKIYSSYSRKIHKRVEEVKSYVNEAWKVCPHKKLVATSTAMLLWNLSSVKMRILAAFMSLVIFRHSKQQTKVVNNKIEREEESSSKSSL